MEIEFTRISSKGQVVIPLDVRKRLSLKDGEHLAVSTKDDLIVLKKINEKMSKEDIATLDVIKEAWKDIEEGRCKKMSQDEFLSEIKKW
jgi:AbrB family looped-hinge helix DNA binding protein